MFFFPLAVYVCGLAVGGAPFLSMGNWIQRINRALELHRIDRSHANNAAYFFKKEKHL